MSLHPTKWSITTSTTRKILWGRFSYARVSKRTPVTWLSNYIPDKTRGICRRLFLIHNNISGKLRRVTGHTFYILSRAAIMISRYITALSGCNDRRKRVDDFNVKYTTKIGNVWRATDIWNCLPSAFVAPLNLLRESGNNISKSVNKALTFCLKDLPWK